MKKFEVIAEIIAVPPNNTKKILDIFEGTSYNIVQTKHDQDGIHYLVVDEEKK